MFHLWSRRSRWHGLSSPRPSRWTRPPCRGSACPPPRTSSTWVQIRVARLHDSSDLPDENNQPYNFSYSNSRLQICFSLISTAWPIRLFTRCCWNHIKSRVLVQGDTSGCDEPPVDFKTKVTLWPRRPGQARPKRNFCFYLNGRFVTTWCVTLYKEHILKHDICFDVNKT